MIEENAGVNCVECSTEVKREREREREKNTSVIYKPIIKSVCMKLDLDS